MNKRSYRNDSMRRLREANVTRLETQYKNEVAQKIKAEQDARVQSEIEQGTIDGAEA